MIDDLVLRKWVNTSPNSCHLDRSVIAGETHLAERSSKLGRVPPSNYCLEMGEVEPIDISPKHPLSSYKQDIEKGYKDKLTPEERYQSVDERKDYGAISEKSVRALIYGKYQNMWCGLPLMKGPLEANQYQILLQREKPATIIEIGAWHGTSAAWMADLTKVFGLKTHVYSVDVDISMVSEKAKRDNVTFKQCDCMKMEEIQATFPEDMLKNLPHPWLISEDAHVNLINLLEYFLKYMQPGDMICVEDASPLSPVHGEYTLKEDADYEKWGPGKLNELRTFLKRNKPKVKIDRLYTDLYGYNGGLNWDGFLRIF